MSNFDLVIFDCDGVVVDSEVLSCACLVETLAEYGITLSLAVVFEQFLGRSFATIEAFFAQAAGHPMPAAFREDYRRRLLASFRQSLQPMPGVRKMLSSLRTPYCLASSSDSVRLTATLAATDLTGAFAGRIFNSEMVEHGKPAPDMFLLAARTLGAMPARTVVVEDTIAGITAAKSAGMAAWAFIGGSHFTNAPGAKRLTEAGADRVVTSMSELGAMLQKDRGDGRATA